MIRLTGVSKCCESPIRMGWRKIKKTNKRVVIWICLNCKKKDVDVLPIIDGKVVRPSHFAQVDTEDRPDYD